MLAQRVYFQTEVVFDEYVEACDFVCQLPSFAVAQINPVTLSVRKRIYQVLVYCFDEEVDVSKYE